MSKFRLIFLSMVAMLLLAGCSGNKATTLSYGDLDLTISEFPNGVSKEDIVVKKMNPDDLPIAGDKQGWKGYDLQPDGTKFSTGVVVSLPYESDTMPQYFHVHDGKIFPIANVEYLVSDGGNTARFSIDSFSYILTYDTGPKVYDLEFSAGDAHVGEYLPIKAKIKMLQDVDDDNNVLYIREDLRRISGSLRLEGPVSPSAMTGRPGETKITDSYTLVSDQDFKCLREGDVEITYNFTLRYRVDYFYKFLGIEREAGGVTKNWPVGTYVKAVTKAKCLKALPPEPKCGDGKVNKLHEECDGNDMNGMSCRDFGYNEGRLTCSPTCLFEYELCRKVAPRREISCSDNSREKYSEYEEGDICAQDCDKGTYCDTETCTCKDQQDPEPIDMVDPDERLKEEINAIGQLINGEQDQDVEDDCDLPGVDCDDEEEGENMIKAIKYKKHIIPLDQIHFGTGPECNKKEHRHGNALTVKTLAGKIIDDPAPDDCGFGETADVPVIEVAAP